MLKINGVTSDTEEINVGAPQGSCLGALSFLLYINDLPFALRKAHTTLYAEVTNISFLWIKLKRLTLLSMLNLLA